MANSEVERTERRWRENRQGFAFANYADALRKTGDAERALEVLREGLALHPTYLPANIVLGRCYLDIGDDDSAHTAFQRVLSLDAENVIALKALAEASERQSKFGEAQRWLEALLLVDRGNEGAREQLARVQEAAIAGPATAVAPAAVEHEAESAQPSFAHDGIAVIDASELTAVHEHAVSAPEHHAVAVDDGPGLAWVGGAETAADAAPLALDDLSAETNVGAIDLHGTAVESLGDASVDELVATPESDAEPISLDTPSIDHGESLADMVEKTDEIQLHSATAAEYQVPDDAETLTLGDSHAPALDLGIERSSPDAVDVGGAVEASSLLEPENDSTSAVDAALPSMLSETVDGATVELASSMHHDTFVPDFEATHVELPDVAAAAAPASLVELVPHHEPAPTTVPEVQVAVVNPVPLAAMPREEILESFRRAAEVRAADIAARPVAPAPEPVVAEPVAVVSEPVAAAAEPVVVIADEEGEVWESPEFGEDVPIPEVVAAVAPAPVDEAPASAPVQEHPEPEPAPEPRSETLAAAEPEAEGAAPELVVTEAMAALYEAQGHRADAREVYRQLALRHPGEARFASKVAALADEPIAPAAAAPAPEPVAAPAPPPAIAYAAAATGGQSVGTFLGSLLRLAPPALSRNGHHAAAQAGGQPTRPATDPVSLHSMFGEDRPAASTTSKPGVATARPQAPSLDEFYGGANSSDAGADQDLEQFHAWLQSLKA